MSGSLFSAGEAAAILFGGFFLLLALRVPVAMALGLACLPLAFPRAPARHDDDRPGDVQRLQHLHPAGRPVLPADGQPDERGRHHQPPVALSRALVGSWPGSLAQINVVLSVFFAGISGSSTADAASQSKIFIDAQTREGYDLLLDRHHRGVGGAGRHHPALDPDDRVGRPDLDLDRRALSRGRRAGPVDRRRADGNGARLCRARGYPTYPRETFRQLLCSIWVSIPALMTPVIIVGGILLGWFTATDRPAWPCYSAVLSMVAYREMNLKGLYNALVDTGRLAVVALFCVGTASAFGWLLAYYRIPQELRGRRAGSWGRSASASSSPSCSWWSAASSMPSRPSSSSARCRSRSPCRST